ncbi:MAG TPA: hypothetical protein H9909_04645, partial [Candidatus Mediterraneibacter norfolkensis]|nr:hypothetical protein [Candidatus Mediterraneibacter norfolkensis]
GYSLLLAPLFHIFHSSTTIYRIAVALNIVLLVLSYLVSCKCAFRLFPDISKKILVFFCLLSSFYGGYIFDVNITWAEPLLLFVFWLLVLTLTNYFDTGSLYLLIISIAESIYLYAIHQRTLGVVIALFLVFFSHFLISSERSHRKYVFLILIIFLIFFAVVTAVKGNLVNSIWSPSFSTSSSNLNDYSGQIGKVISFFTSGDFFVSVIKGFLSKTFYLLCASGLLILWGMYFIVYKNFHSDLKNAPSQMIYIFCFLSVLALEGISALYVNNSSRLDTVLYGRYAEFAAAPLILFGLCFLYQNMGTTKVLLSGIFIYLLLSLTATGQLFEGSGNMYLSSVVGNIFYDSATDRMNTGYLIVIPLLIGIFLFVLFQQRRRILYFVAVIPLLSLWIYADYYTLKVDVNESQRLASGYNELCDDITELGEDLPIYFVYKEELGNSNWNIERVQFSLYDRKIQLIMPEDVDSLSGDHILLQYSLNGINMDDYTVYSQAHGMVAAVPTDASLAEAALSKQFEESVFDPTDRTNGIEDYGGRYSLSSSHKEGMLSYGNNLSLNAGTYEVNLSFHVSEITDTSLGCFDITTDQGANELLWSALTTAEIDEDGYAELTYTFTCENSNFVEFRVYTYDTSLFELDSITYQRIM